MTKVLDLSSLKDRMEPLSKSGIYSLCCSCGDTYIGQTGRTIEKRKSTFVLWKWFLPHPTLSRNSIPLWPNIVWSLGTSSIPSNLLFCTTATLVLGWTASKRFTLLMLPKKLFVVILTFWMIWHVFSIIVSSGTSSIIMAHCSPAFLVFFGVFHLVCPFFVDSSQFNTRWWLTLSSETGRVP